MTPKTSFIAAPGQPTLVVTRTFEAPRTLVFEAVTQAKHIAQWYGPNGFTNPVCEVDLRVGGAYRIVNRDPKGGDHGFRGVYRELTPPARLVRTWIYEPQPESEAVETLELTEKDGRTTLTWTTRFPSVAARDACLEAGAQEGGAQTLERLAGHLAELLAG
jgi:uncharacterized protein YndB with AHSA1/START domain